MYLNNRFIQTNFDVQSQILLICFIKSKEQLQYRYVVYYKIMFCCSISCLQIINIDYLTCLFFSYYLFVRFSARKLIGNSLVTNLQWNYNPQNQFCNWSLGFTTFLTYKPKHSFFLSYNRYNPIMTTFMNPIN